MSKGDYKLLSLIAFGMVLFILVIVLSPRAIDWRLSFSKQHTKPYGDKALYELLSQLEPSKNLVVAHTSLLEFLGTTTPVESGFIFVCNHFNTEEADVAKMLEVVDAGNQVFIASHDYGEALMDTFKIKIENGYYNPIGENDSLVLNFANRRLKTAFGYTFKKGISNSYFTAYDSTKITVLGYNQKGQTNFIRVTFGDGYFYFHSNPLVFTNYNLVKGDNYEYIFKALSYLPSTGLVWDEYYKDSSLREKTILSYIMDHTALKYAYYLFFIGLILFFVFQSKRVQRIIPVIEPIQNTSKQFVETIGRLYLSKKNHVDLAQKKFIYFLEFLRSHYYFRIDPQNPTNFEELAAKSGISQKTIEQLFAMGAQLKNTKSINWEELSQFNQKIEYFYQHCK